MRSQKYEYFEGVAGIPFAGADIDDMRHMRGSCERGDETHEHLHLKKGNRVSGDYSMEHN